MGETGGARVLLRNRSVIPILLTVALFLYEFGWRGRYIEAGSLAERLTNLAVIILLGGAAAWWGHGSTLGLLSRLARSEAASEEKSRLLEQRNRQLQTLLQACRAMTAVHGLKQVGAAVVEQVVGYTRFTRAMLIMGPDERGAYDLLAARGLNPEFLERFVAELDGPHRASTPVEWCRLTRQPVVVENLQKDFRTAGLPEVYALAGAQGLVGVPLTVRDQFRGTLVVFLEQGGAVTTAEISMVSALAGQAALALENASLQTDEEPCHAEFLTTGQFLQGVAGAVSRTRVGVAPALQGMAQATAALFAPARARVAVSKPDRQTELKVTEAVGIQPDQDCHPAFTQTLTAENEALGEFQVLLPDKGRALSEPQLRLLDAAAQLTTSVISNASLLTEMRQTVDEVERAYMGTLEALTKALEMRDHETEGHSRRVVQYTLSLAQKLGTPEQELVPIIRGALLHDIGKIGIPDAILKKAGPLTESEWEVMRQHPVIGFEMLQGIEFLRQATPIILHHHERYDGTGYPGGLAGEAIPLGARIFAVADAYDAITSDRPYRRGREHLAAVAEITAASGRQFDPAVVEALLALPAEELARIRGQEQRSASLNA